MECKIKGPRRASKLGVVFAAIVAAVSFSASVSAHTDTGMPQQIIVKYKQNALASKAQGNAIGSALQSIGARHGMQLNRLRTMGTGAEVVHVNRNLDDAELASLLADFKADPNVEYAEEDRIMHALLTPNDTQYNQQWDFFESAGGINVQTAWDTTTGSGVVIASIDTGYRPHADLVGNILPGYDFISSTSNNDGNGRDSDATDPGDYNSAGQCGTGSAASNSSWHGTHVAGTAAAVTNNALGVAGVAFGAKIVPLRVLGRCGGTTSDIADAIIWGSGGGVSGVPTNVNPAKVLSLSLGGSGACDTTTQAAINSARSRNATVVVAAGNSNANAANFNPASCTGIITVASVGRTGGKAYYSNFGAVVDVAAPGGDQQSGTANGILSTFNTGTTTPGSDSYGYYQGTSQATPHVAGVAALLYAAKPTLTTDQVISAITSTARAFPATCSQCGSGIVNAAAAVASLSGGGGSGPTVLQNGVAVSGQSAATGADLVYTIAVPAGASNLSIVASGGSGDADLYVKFGSQPTLSSYDCRPYLSGNAETCTFATTQTGTYYIVLHAYAAFSGLTLKASYTTGGGGACAAGFTATTGTLSATGANVYAPNSSGFSGLTGTYSGRLTGPASVDFDLYLQKLSGSTWSSAASSTGNTATESIDYNGSSGTYRWRVYSYSGTGSFTLCTKNP